MDKLNQWLGLVANFGVVLGIVFLAIEIQQNTRSLDEDRKYAAASAYQARTDSSMALYNFRDPEVFAKLVEGATYVDLSGPEQQKFRAFIHMAVLSIGNVLYQQELGLIPPDMMANDTEFVLRAYQGAKIVGIPVRPSIEKYLNKLKIDLLQ